MQTQHHISEQPRGLGGQRFSKSSSSGKRQREDKLITQSIHPNSKLNSVTVFVSLPREWTTTTKKKKANTQHSQVLFWSGNEAWITLHASGTPLHWHQGVAAFSVGIRALRSALMSNQSQQHNAEFAPGPAWLRCFGHVQMWAKGNPLDGGLFLNTQRL